MGGVLKTDGVTLHELCARMCTAFVLIGCCNEPRIHARGHRARSAFPAAGSRTRTLRKRRPPLEYNDDVCVHMMTLGCLITSNFGISRWE